MTWRVVQDWMVTWNRSQIFSRFCVQSGYTGAFASDLEPFFVFVLCFLFGMVSLYYLGKWKMSIHFFNDINDICSEVYIRYI